MKAGEVGASKAPKEEGKTSFAQHLYHFTGKITRQFWGSAPRSEVDLEEFRNSRLSWTDQYGHSFGKFLTKDIVVEDMKNLEVTDENAGNLLSDIISLISDHRMFLADTALDKLEAFLKQNPHLEVVKTLEAEINQKHRARFQQLRDRVQRLRRAESDFDEHEGWTVVQDLQGSRTYFRNEDNGSMTIKLVGQMETIYIFDQIAALREGDFYAKWAPGISNSRLIKMVGKIELVIWYIVTIPAFAAQDAVLYFYGCDNLESGHLYLIGQSIESMEDVELPPKPKGWISDRTQINDFSLRFNPTSPTTYDLNITFNMDINLWMPRSVINYGVKKLAGYMLQFLEKVAKKSAARPANSLYATLMRNDPFYGGYVGPRLVSLYRAKGWPLLHFPALEVEIETDSDIEAAALRAWKELVRDGNMAPALSTIGSGEFSSGDEHSARYHSTSENVNVMSPDRESDVSAAGSSLDKTNLVAVSSSHSSKDDKYHRDAIVD